MQRFICPVMVMCLLSAGCATLGVRTEGTSGPIAWQAIDLKSESAPVLQGTIGNSTGRYSLTLVLKETQGIPITFTYRKDNIYASGLTVSRSVDQAINVKFKPYEERRFPLTFTWGCS